MAPYRQRIAEHRLQVCVPWHRFFTHAVGVKPASPDLAFRALTVCSYAAGESNGVDVHDQ